MHEPGLSLSKARVMLGRKRRYRDLRCGFPNPSPRLPVSPSSPTARCTRHPPASIPSRCRDRQGDAEAVRDGPMETTIAVYSLRTYSLLDFTRANLHNTLHSALQLCVSDQNRHRVPLHVPLKSPMLNWTGCCSPYSDTLRTSRTTRRPVGSEAVRAS